MASSNTKDNLAYEEAMDDVHTRFILNLPDEELQSAPRIFFQLEQAWWFYDDFICDGAAAAAAAAAANEAESGEVDGDAEGSNDKKKKKKKKKDIEEPLPRFKHVKPFSLAMFQFSPLLQPMLPEFDTMYAEFNKYKRSISTYGTILLNMDATKMALCRTWKGKSWTLPGGKVNQNESGKDAAARETYEESGFDPECERGVCGVWMERKGRGEIVEELQEEDEDDDEALPWLPLQDSDKLVYTESDTNKRRTCYVCRGVPENFPFEPVARKEISEVSWHELTSLPKHTFAVLPFLGQLRKWIKRDNRKRGIENGRGASRAGSRPRSRGKGSTAKQRRGSGGNKPLREDLANDEDEDIGLTPFFSNDGNAPWEKEGVQILKKGGEDVVVESSGKGAGDNDGGKKKRTSKKKEKRDGSQGKKRPNSRSSRSGSRGAAPREVTQNDPLVLSALASPGDPNRWTEDEMFATNEQIMGRKITYDGNPHDFAEKGFDVGGGENGGGRVDPHAFRVVGGKFMNSGDKAGGGGVLSGACPPEASRLQPLMAKSRARSGSKCSNVSGLSSDADGGGGGDAVDDGGMGLTPFFSDDGKAPWEEEMGAGVGALLQAVQGSDQKPPKEKHMTPPPVRSAPPASGQSNSKGLALLNRLRQGTSANEEGGQNENVPSSMTAQFNTDDDDDAHAGEKNVKKKESEENKANNVPVSGGSNFDDLFMTDREITAKSQKEKLSILPPLSDHFPQAPPPTQPPVAHPRPLVSVSAQPDGNIQTKNEHLVWMKHWVQQLSQAGPTQEFGDFRLDVNAVMNALTTSI